MPKHFPTVVFVLAHILLQCQSPQSEVKDALPYRFAKPEYTFELDKDLREISGLAWWNEDTLVSIEDESATIYFLSAKDGSIIKKTDFGDKGDYEGIAVVEREIYVLRSDGDLFKVKHPLREKTKADKNETDLSQKDDAEGLCFETKSKSFLIAAKEEGETKGNRVIYQMGIGEKDIDKKPYLLIDEEALLKALHTKYGNRFGSSFKPSGIAFHPLTDDLYIVSAANHLLAAFDDNKELIDVVKLPKTYAKQVEGICFAPDGRLFISTEGGDEKGNIVVLKMMKWK
ncbi:SdiA-regulated domain-containing protein [Cryomorphaceae bacterium 1068]|nr:SdiA-regulated domain-containing protein [Cryomorphaceae bacterium 1068]